jgi:hypothetical protein
MRQANLAHDEVERALPEHKLQTVAQTHPMAGTGLQEMADPKIRFPVYSGGRSSRRWCRAELRDFPGSILDRVELEPTAATLQVCYRIPLRSGFNVASPRGFGTIPTIIARSLAKVA